MSMKALLLKGLSAYEATTTFIDEAAQAFRRRGVEARVVDLGPPTDEMGFLTETLAGETFDFVFTIGLFGELRDAGGRDVGEVAGGPLVVQYVDYPLSHYARLGPTSPATALLVVDPSHAEAVRSVYGEARFRSVAFSPHGAIGEPHPREPDAGAFLAARPIPILFPGSFYRPGPPMWAQLDPPTRRVFELAVDIALSTEFIPALEAFDQALEQRGGHLRGTARSDMRINAFAVHEHVRRHRRFEMLKALARAGLPVQVAGAGYAKDLYRFKNVTHLGEHSLGGVVELMRRSRVVLNVNANFGRGSHERPLSAMTAGAVAATDASTFYDEAFAADELVQLRWSRLDEDLQALGRLLDDGEALFRMAGRGQARATAEHRWDQRVDAILAAAGLAAPS